MLRTLRLLCLRPCPWLAVGRAPWRGTSFGKRPLHGPVAFGTLWRVRGHYFGMHHLGVLSTNASGGRGRDVGAGLMAFGCERSSKITSMYSMFLLFDVRVSYLYVIAKRKSASRADWKATGAGNLLQEFRELEFSDT